MTYQDGYAERWKTVEKEQDAARRRIDQALANEKRVTHLEAVLASRNRAMAGMMNQPHLVTGDGKTLVKCFTPRCSNWIAEEGVRCDTCLENIKSWEEKP